jgi:tetratricopeptide (TPR) repeat protein
MLPKLSLPQVVKEDATPVSTISFVLGAAFDAHRDGMLDTLLSQRPGALRWLVRHYLQPILGTAGDALVAHRQMSQALEWLLAWGVTRIRPDRELSLTIKERQDWLARTSWRPAIALMCHYGFMPVPDFRDRYYRRPDESPAENLCGLWNIGQSTFYRYLDKGKRLVALVLYEQRLDRRHSQSLRDFAQQRAYEQLRLDDPDARRAWHHTHVESALKSRDYLSALWHCRMAREHQQAAQLIQHFIADLAGQPELDQHLAALHQSSPAPADEINLCLVEGELGRVRGDLQFELARYEQALRLAVQSRDDVALGLVYSRLGKHYESRDSDRAFAYYQDSIELLDRALQANKAEGVQFAMTSARDEYAATLVKLGWSYALRNDPRAQTLLDKAESLRSTFDIGLNTIALLEQAWGEYWRRAGKPERALEHKHRVLNLYERSGDDEGVIKTYINLGLVYIDLQRFDTAAEYFNAVLERAQHTPVSPELAGSAEMHLGICHFWRRDYGAAIRHYQQSLDVFTAANLRLRVAYAHHNLAEAYYTRFASSHDAADESRGDAHARQAAESYTAEGNLAYVQIVRELKHDILSGVAAELTKDRLLSSEHAAHVTEMSDVEQHRAALAAPGPPEDHVRAHLAIANAYLAISAKEREQALALIDKHGLHDQFAGEFAQLRATYERELTREQKLSAQWKAQAGDFINDERRAAVLAHLIEHGAINKSAYAETCGVGLATASKHLVTLAERGLVQQVGKGPSTRYVLPHE